MESKYTFRPANQADINRIWEIIQQAKAQMYREEKQQWNESYPAMQHLSADIDHCYAYVLCKESSVIAYGAIVFDGEPMYDIIDGCWLSDLPYVVVHRIAIADEMKHRGIATLFMQEVEKLSVQKGVHSFKVDTNFDNFGMQKVLAKCGFSYCGEITYQRGKRMAYEKMI